MGLRFYMDVHVHRGITTALRVQGIEVLTAQEDGAGEFEDRPLLARATELGYVFHTNDEDFMREAAYHQREGIPFAGIVFARQRESVGVCVEQLTLMGLAMDMAEMANQIKYLPL